MMICSRIEKLFKIALSFLFLNFTTQCILPLRLLLWKLHRHGHKNLFHDYYRRYIQLHMNIQRRRFLAESIALKVIPKFLKFRVPNNGCFKVEAVRSFQKRLLKQELAKAQKEKTAIEQSEDQAAH